MPKRTICSQKSTYLSLYTTCWGSVLNMTGLYNRNGAKLYQTAIYLEKQLLQSHTLAHLNKTNMHGSCMYLMYSQYLLFYEPPKNWRYYMHTQTVCTRPLLRGEGPGDKATCKLTDTVPMYVKTL